MDRKDTLTEEDLEIAAVTGGSMPLPIPGRITRLFPAFAHRNYQLYFFGQSISLVGFWLQQVAIGWLVFELTHSALWVGIAFAAGGLPFLLFSAFAGVFIDKTDKQRLIIWTQIGEATIALILGLIVLNGLASLPLVLFLAFLSGMVGSIDLPARLAFLIEMVGRDDLASATGINVGVFNAARFVGPALAGLLIASFGVGWAFILNGVSFLPPIMALLKIRPIYRSSPAADQHPIESLKEGLAFVFHNEKLLFFMLLASAMAIFVWPYQSLMPVVAEKVFSSGPAGLGTLLSATGAGSLAGAVFTSSRSRQKNNIKPIFVGILVAGVSLVAFSFNYDFGLAHVLLFAAGFGVIVSVSLLNTMVQLSAPDQMRGRIMAVYLTMFVGMMPLGNSLLGAIAERTSILFSIRLGALVMLIASSWIYFKKASSWQ